MTTPVNLNKARKARDKVKSRAQADENVVKFGRTKGQKRQETAQRDQAVKSLDQHKRDQ